jgi:hypothetical protein
MSDWLGEFPEDYATVTCMFTTHSSAGAPLAPSSAFEAADVIIYKNGNAAQKTTTNGVTMTSPFDSITGLHCVVIDTSNDTGDGGFWVAGAVYTLVLSADETVDGVAVAKVIGQFGIELAEVLRPTTAGRQLDVSAGGEAGIDWANIGSPTTAVNLSGTNIDVDQVVASVSGAVGSVTGAVGSVTGAVGSVSAGGLTAASFAANAITAAKLDPDVTTELQAGLATAAALAVVDGIVDDILLDTAEIGAAGAGLTNINLPNQTMDIIGNITGNLSGSVGSVTGLTASDVGAIKLKTDNLPSDPADQSIIITATDAILTAVGDVPTNAELATALGTADDATLTAIAAVDTKLDTLDTVADAIKAKTDSLTFTVAGQADVNVQYVNDVQVNGVGTAGNPWGP